MTAPQININGTKGSVLIEGYIVAKNAMIDALEKLHETAPHGRDYPNADWLKRATTEHLERVKSLEKIRDELYDMVMLFDVMDKVGN